MRIYALTPIGRKLARSTSNPDSPAYRVVAHLDQTGHATVEQVAEFSGLSASEASGILRVLRRKRVVSEVSGVSF